MPGRTKGHEVDGGTVGARRDRRLRSRAPRVRAATVTGHRAVAPAQGAWKDRPAGLPGAVPPPSVPLSFLAASAVGLVACGVAWVWARRAAAADPTSDPVVAAVHFGVLAALSTGILGATHQFTPVITGRPLRSVVLARATLCCWLVAAWMLPLGVATETLALTALSGAAAGVAVVLLVANLAGSLAVRGKGTPVTALRLALGGAVATSLLGAAFVADRQGDWFQLPARVDLTMGIVGLFGWLGLTYVGVAEKLWPMFMLAHVPGRRLAGRLAVWAVAAGTALFAGGLAFGGAAIAWAGALTLAAGLGAHLSSLAAHVRHRRRRADLHLAFVLTAGAWLVVGAALGVAAVVELPTRHHLGASLAAAAVAAVAGWLAEALVGHAHKVVPFIAWSALRARGISTGPSGRQFLFADLYGPRSAKLTYGLVTAGIGGLCVGLGATQPAATATGGVLLALAGAVAGVNLAAVPARLLAHRASPRRPGAAAPAAAGEPTRRTRRRVRLTSAFPRKPGRSARARFEAQPRGRPR